MSDPYGGPMRLQDFQLGKDYTFASLEEAHTQDVDFRELMPDCDEKNYYLGKVYVYLEDEDRIVGFVLTGASGNQYIYTCVFKTD